MTEQRPTRRRRWLRYSLRVLLVLVTVLSVWLGWLVHRARQQAAAVDVVLRSGGDVYYEWYYDPQSGAREPESRVRTLLGALFGDEFARRVTHVALGQEEMHPADLEPISGLQDLNGISADGTQLTDDAMAFLASHTDLETVSFRGSPVGDKALAYLRACRELKELYVPETRVTNRGLANLVGHANLDVVNVAGTEVTDAGLAHLKSARNLRVLDLSHTKVTDEGLSQLRDFRNLILLRLVGTGVTDAAVQNLQVALPKCSISR